MMVVETFKKLLRSRKFMTAVMAIVFNVLVGVFPDIEHVTRELMVMSVVIWTVLAGTWGIEDAAEKGREVSIEVRDTNEDAIRAILDEILESRKHE